MKPIKLKGPKPKPRPVYVARREKGAGSVVREGEILTDFRGDKAKFIGVTRPPDEGGPSTGRVEVEWIKDGFRHSYYPSVFDLVLVKE